MNAGVSMHVHVACAIQITVKALNFAWDLFREFRVRINCFRKIKYHANILAVQCNKHKIHEIKFQ